VSNGYDGDRQVLAREGSAAPGTGDATFKAFTAVSIRTDSTGIAPASSGTLFTATLLVGTGAPLVATTSDTGAW